MNYPIDFTFKLLALASQIYIRDARGDLLGYAKQKMFKLKEDVRIFADENQTQELYQIKADRVIDFSARYNFIDSRTGQSIGSIKRRGMRSLWKASYEIFDGERVVMEIKEENAMIKVFDALVGEIPVVSTFTGYFLNPAYLCTQTNGTTVARLQKQPAFFEGKFQLSQQRQMLEMEEKRVMLGFLMMTLLERSRG